MHFKNLASMGLQVHRNSPYKFGTQVAIEMAHLAIFGMIFGQNGPFSCFPAPNSQKCLGK
jgi:hypothetical protein